jgi:hypothetical protein
MVLDIEIFVVTNYTQLYYVIAIDLTDSSRAKLAKADIPPLYYLYIPRRRIVSCAL